MKKKIKISKLDAAKRQLETAIRLYFNYGDPVAIHTLACAAHEILSDLNKKYSGKPMVVSDFMIKDEYKKHFMKMIREPQNFFKHANKDPENTIDFNPDVSHFFIFDAISKYQEITEEIVPFFVIFRGWFGAQHIDIFYFSNEKKVFISNTISKYGNDRSAYFSDMLEVSGYLK
jgi:hypothetical protein